jgi:hypothetical protein
MKNYNVDDVMAAILAAGMGSCAIKDICQLNGRCEDTSEFVDVAAFDGDRTIEPIGFSKYYGKNAVGDYVRIVAHQEDNAVMRFVYLNDRGDLEVGTECAHEMHILTDHELYKATGVLSPKIKDQPQWAMLDRLYAKGEAA